MENIWAFLMQTLTASVAAAVLLIAKRLFWDKLSPRWQYGVWAILAVRILLPAGLLDRTLLPGLDLLLETGKLAAERNLSSGLTALYGGTEVTAPVPLVRPVPPASITDGLFYLYAAGVILALLWFFLSYLALRRRVAGGEEPDPAVLEGVRQAACRYELPMPRRVVVLPGVESAFVCGPLARVLVLPERAVDDKVLLHELLHLKHGDLWAGVGICLLRCLHWCNPLLWYCWDQAQNDCEALCDQRVLERLEGEQRREYGVILLSMADDRYARAPGTTSMANGGKNIKHRIGAIARFKRYPRGVALGARCVAVVLAAACLAGTGGAVTVPEYDQRGALAVTKAMLTRPTTVAGALDTYAKAVLCDSPVYWAMVAPEEARDQALQAAEKPFEEVDLYASSFWDLGYTWSRPAWQAEWSVMDLLPDGAGGYVGTVLFLPLERDDTFGILSQPVAVHPSGDLWTVEPLEELTPWDLDPVYIPDGPGLPTITYTAEEAGLRLEIDLQYSLGTGYAREAGDGPQPHIQFTEYYHSVGGRACDLATGREVSLAGVEVWPLDSAGEWGGCGTSVDLPNETGDGGGGTAGPSSGVGLDCVAALALNFTYDGRIYTCTALPEEVTP